MKQGINDAFRVAKSTGYVFFGQDPYPDDMAGHAIAGNRLAHVLEMNPE
ncbi:MAG: hypothetical protein OXK72_03785 [Gammaproteobacteria bacterium]|nr:hypothetical protein [Gammaproteobacteria bacterium]